jgi:hypothetical protein
MLRILYHGTIIEANFRNSVLNHSPEEKTIRNSVPWNKNRNKLSEFRSKTFSDENILFAGAGFFVKLIFFMPCPSVPSLGIDSSESSKCLGMSTFFRGIMETIPSLFRGIFSEQNSIANPGAELRFELGPALKQASTLKN